jgi:hypothetical protein
MGILLPSLNMVFIPFLSLRIGIYQIRKVSKFCVWRSIDSLGSVIPPASTGRFALWWRGKIPRRLLG